MKIDKDLKLLGFLIIAGLVSVVYLWQAREKKEMKKPRGDPSLISLPSPQTKGEISLEEAVAQRRSRREFSQKPLSLKQLSQILWSAQGISGSEGFKRTAPSAGALYPLEVYLVVGEKGGEGLATGVYHYLPQEHSLEKLKEGDLRNNLAQAALGQGWVAEAPVSLVIAAEYERTTSKYGQRGQRYVQIEVGHVGQNVYLQAEALGLGTVAVGAFDDQEVGRVLNLPANYYPLYIMPLGWPR